MDVTEHTLAGEEQRGHHSGRSHARHGDPPTKGCRQPTDDHRREHPPQAAGATVRAVGAAKPARMDSRVEDRVVGGMEDAVAAPGRGHGRHQRPVRWRHSRKGDGGREERQAARQHAPGAETIHEKARDRLADRRGCAPGRDQTTERGVGDAELDAEEWKERGKDEAVEVAEEMANTDDGDDVGVGGGGRDSSG